MRRLLTILTVLTVIGACGGDDDAASIRELASTHGAAAVEPVETDPALFELGRMLFFDPLLSGNRDVSCSTCHSTALATTDGMSLAIGTSGDGFAPSRVIADALQANPRHAPDLFNRGHESWLSFFWDGRVAVEGGRLVTPAGDALPPSVTDVQVAQVFVTVASPLEMRGLPGDETLDGDLNELALFAPDEWEAIWEATMDRVLANPTYVELLAAAYPQVASSDLTFEHAAIAIAAFQADAFSSTNTPWDRFLAGDDDALSDTARRGAALFYGDAGCANCHSGPLLTDQEYWNLAVPQVGPGRGNASPGDDGRGAVTGIESEEMQFRTPPLRNVARTGPWMHNGAYTTLAAAVAHHLDPAGALASYDTAQVAADVDTGHTVEILRVQRQTATAVAPAAIRPLDEGDLADLEAFLGALTDPDVGRLGDLVPDAVPSGLLVYP